MYVFSGTPQDMMRAVLDDLEQAGHAGDQRAGYMNRAMSRLVGVRDREAAEGPASEEETREFRRRVADALVGLGNAVPAYLMHTMIDAVSANDEELYDLAIRRSAIQSLLDDLAGTPVPGLIDSGELEDLDEELRRVAASQGPLAPEAAPRGIPHSHWWWRAPDAT
jgi:hypothetical protein